MTLIHPTAIVDKTAEIDHTVEIGPNVIIEGHVRIAAPLATVWNVVSDHDTTVNHHALQAIAAGLKERQLTPALQAQTMFAAAHAAEQQLPEAWLPFVVSR